MSSIKKSTNKESDFHNPALDTIAYLVHRISLLARIKFNQLVKDYGLTSTQWQILSLLYQDEGQTQTAIASQLAIGKSSIGKSIDSLERRGWVHRKPDERDRRSNRVYLTQKFHSTEVEFTGPVLEVEEELLQSFSATERKQLEQQLRRILIDIEQAE
jgi:MarR family transcriptional regulator for hemolysin